MKLRTLSIRSVTALASLCAIAFSSTSCRSGNNTEQASDSQNDSTLTESTAGKKVGGPQLGKPGGGPSIDKSGDETLQAMIKAEIPLFRQLVYSDKETGIELKYNLFSPQHSDENPTSFPLVLFMADASTPGDNYTTPLTQGYGALVWATEQWQKDHPCFVLVPQFAGVAVNDAYEHTDEVDVVIRLLSQIASDYPVDKKRIYTTGQSMGGMISMYYNINYPDIFAASLFVDCHWDTSRFDKLAERTFTYITAGKNGKSFGNIGVLEKAVEQDGRKYAFAEWSARLPQAEQDSLATQLLAQGAPVNIINFSPGSVLPPDGKGSEHMYSFDYAYRLTPVREWLFRQSR